MKRNQLKKQHIAQLFMSIIIIVLAAYSLSFLYYRFDLTSEKRYTLSPVSLEILENLEDVIFIKVYLEGDLNVGFKRMRNSIQELLDEFRVIAKENIEYEFINPSGSVNTNVRNAVYNELVDKGLKPINIHERDAEGKITKKMVFPGIILNYGEKEMSVDLLFNHPAKSGEENLNNSIETLEFNIINTINKLIAEKDKTIAFIEGHGELDEYETGDITEELSAFYNIHRVRIEGQIELLNNYTTLIIAKPQQPFPERDKLAIDQYIMNGGTVLWLIDPVHVSMDSLSRSSFTWAYIVDLNLDDQLFRYGIRLLPNLVQDMNCALIPVNIANTARQPEFVPAPWLYYPLINPSDKHPVTRKLNYVKAEFASTIDTVKGSRDVTKIFLLQTSRYTRNRKAPIRVSLSQISSDPNPADFNNPFQSLAVLLEGRFESVFKNRIITKISENKNLDFKDKSLLTKMIVIADGDIIKNHVSRKTDGILISPLGYDRYTQQTYGNKEFILNAINYLNDEKGLMEMRSRQFTLRLLNKTKIQEERLKWQIVNTVIPIVLVVLFGIGITYFRKKKYA